MFADSPPASSPIFFEARPPRQRPVPLRHRVLPGDYAPLSTASCPSSSPSFSRAISACQTTTAPVIQPDLRLIPACRRLGGQRRPRRHSSTSGSHSHHAVLSSRDACSRMCFWRSCALVVYNVRRVGLLTQNAASGRRFAPDIPGSSRQGACHRL